MRAVIQRVKQAAVTINGTERRSIGVGVLVFIGIEDADTIDDIEWLSGKIVRLRVFPDAENVMNLSIDEIQGQIMLISQFTLHASTKKGNRPSYIRSAKPETAVPLYNQFIEQLTVDHGKLPVTGEFGAHMDIELINDGPVTIFIDTRNRE
jgi:D-aminoacyl-tRNA deacylase